MRFAYVLRIGITPRSLCTIPRCCGSGCAGGFVARSTRRSSGVTLAMISSVLAAGPLNALLGTPAISGATGLIGSGGSAAAPPAFWAALCASELLRSECTGGGWYGNALLVAIDPCDACDTCDASSPPNRLRRRGAASRAVLELMCPHEQRLVRRSVEDVLRRAVDALVQREHRLLRALELGARVRQTMCERVARLAQPLELVPVRLRRAVPLHARALGLLMRELSVDVGEARLEHGLDLGNTRVLAHRRLEPLEVALGRVLRGGALLCLAACVRVRLVAQRRERARSASITSAASLEL